MSNYIDIGFGRLYLEGMDGRWAWVNRSLGQRIATARKKLRLTQQDLADRIDRSRASVANMEAGKQPIQIQMIFELADKLQVTPADLIPAVSESGRFVNLSEVQVVEQIKRQLNETLQTGG
jgi:transcriptional regulator with XRE-family HTH domain